MSENGHARAPLPRIAAGFAALSLVLTALVSAQPAGAFGTTAHAAAPASTASGDSSTIELSNPALASEPQLSISGPVSIVSMDLESSVITQYSVLTDVGAVRIEGELDALTGGSIFTGTVALPTSLTERMPSRYASRIDSSADSPISTNAVEGTQLVELAQAEPDALQVVSATITLAAATIGTSAHVLDVAVLNGASFDDSTVDAQVSGLDAFWVGQSNGAITSVTRSSIVKRYTSAYLQNCLTSSNWANQVWAEAAAKFGTTVNAYYTNSGRHLVVIAQMPTSSNPSYCSEGIGSVGGGTNGGGLIVGNIDVVTLHTLAHEFGHNLGLGHADVQECESPTLVEGTPAQGCHFYEYEDYYDVMSGGYSVGSITTNQLAALNVTDRVRLGFLPGGDLVTVGGSGASMSLLPASSFSGVRGVKVTDALTGSTYYVEYRSGTGMDAGAFYTHNFGTAYGVELGSLRPGVRILKLGGTDPSLDSTVLAMLKQPGDPYKMLALKPGDVFTTPSGGLTVSFTGVSDGNANITIGLHALPETERIAGSNRYATAVAVSKKAFPDPVTSVPVVYVAQGADYPDALAAAPAAVAEGGPLLLTDSNTLTPIVKAEIQRLNPDKIVVVGGEGVVKPAVFNALKALVTNTIRMGGANRYETARLVVQQAFIDRDGAPATVPIAYIATGSGFPDALSASAAAGTAGAPVILVNGSLSSVDAATKALLQELGVTQTRIAGGTGVVSTGVQNSLATVSTVTRYAGSNRFDTNHKVNSAIFSSGADDVYLATGFQFPDALAGAALAGAKGAPLYLVQTTCVPAQIRADIVAGNAELAWLIGGTGVLTSRVASFTSC
jgi:putative cell wall-binding protein